LFIKVVSSIAGTERTYGAPVREENRDPQKSPPVARLGTRDRSRRD
jgi:hypothetical protein